MTEADIALVAAVCRVESSAYGEDGFADRQEAAEVGVTRTRLMVQDAQRFMSDLIRMIAASGVITALHPLMLPLLLLAVLPAGAGPCCPRVWTTRPTTSTWATGTSGR